MKCARTCASLLYEATLSSQSHLRLEMYLHLALLRAHIQVMVTYPVNGVTLCYNYNNELFTLVFKSV